MDKKRLHGELKYFCDTIQDTLDRHASDGYLELSNAIRESIRYWYAERGGGNREWYRRSVGVKN